MTEVLFVAHAFPRHEGDLVGSFLLRLAVALADRGVRVSVVAPAGAGLAGREWLGGVEVRRYRYAPGRAEALAYHGSMHERVSTPAGALALGGLLGAGALAVRRRGAGRLVHAHWWFPGGVQALAAGRRPLVTTLHGTDVRLLGTRAGARAACARVLRASAVVTTVSRWLRDRAVEVAPDRAEGIRVVPMPVDVGTFTPGEGPRDELLFVGRLDRQKGLSTALRALPLLRGPAAELPLRVVGGGPEAASLRRLAGALGVAERVRWEGPLPQATLAERYRRAAALLVPGGDEGLGLVAVEAQLAGAPVVAAASGGLLDVVEDGATGRAFAPGQPEALARAASDLLADPARAATLAAAGRHAAATRFSPEAAAKAYAAIYEEALRPGPGRSGRRGRRRGARR